MTFAFGDDDDGQPIPLVYLACRLTGITEIQRKLLDGWCTIIEQAVTESTNESATSWNVAVHTPLSWSAPWNDSRPEQDVYRFNSSTVESCAAVIILCVDGGGLGVGQEFASTPIIPVRELNKVDPPKITRNRNTTESNEQTSITIVEHCVPGLYKNVLACSRYQWLAAPASMTFIIGCEKTNKGVHILDTCLKNLNHRS